MIDFQSTPAPRSTRRALLTGGTAAAVWAFAGPHASAIAATMEESGTVAGLLANYAAKLSFGDLAAEDVETIKIHLIDAFGAAIAALREPPVEACRRIALMHGSGSGADVIGSHQQSAPDLAAFANGVALRFYDLNDVYVGKQTIHPSDGVAPTFAVGQAENVSGADLITAVALVYEICCRICQAANFDEKGWGSSNPSLPAVALTAGKLMGLSAAQLEQAVNISLSDHLSTHQSRVGALTDWKGISDAEAARNAVFSAVCARNGLSGPGPIFEGKFGLFNQTVGPFPLDPATFGGKGTPFLIRNCSIKPYPAHTNAMTVIPAAVAVVRQAGSVDNIAAIDIATQYGGYVSAGNNPLFWAPKIKEMADRSFPYIVARVMMDGDLTLASYAKDKLTDPKVLALMQKIKVKEDPALTAMGPKLLPNRLTVILKDGRTITEQVDNIHGFVGLPMRRADVEAKFLANTNGNISAAASQTLFDAVWNLDAQPNLKGLANALAAAG